MLENMLYETSIEEYIPPPNQAGVPYGGGFYAGRFKIDTDTYALVVAGKQQGESPELRYSSLAVRPPELNNTSLSDGLLNAQIMESLGIENFPAMEFCRGLSIGGYTDWYTPSADELEMLYRAFKPTTGQNAVTAYGPRGKDGVNPTSIPVGTAYTKTVPARTTVTAFMSGGAEAFDTVNYGTSSARQNALNSYSQNLGTGAQSYLAYSSPIPVRAVRRVLIKE